MTQVIKTGEPTAVKQVEKKEKITLSVWNNKGKNIHIDSKATATEYSALLVALEACGFTSNSKLNKQSVHLY